MGAPEHTQNLQKLGPFKIANVLGFNGVAATLKGFDENTALPSAIVAIHKSDLVYEESWPYFVQEFRPMITAGASRICQPVSYGEHEDHYWAAYQWMAGAHLGGKVRDDGLPPVSQAFQWMSELADAVATLHRRGVSHRIINPASIFINDLVQASLLHSCWGRILLSCEEGLLNPAFGSILPFVAPEVARGEGGEEACDVYSIGANLYFLLTGQPVFWNDDANQLLQTIQSQHVDLTTLRQTVPPMAVEIVEEMLAHDPAERPVNLPALSDRLLAIANAIDLTSSQSNVQLQNPSRTQPGINVAGVDQGQSGAYGAYQSGSHQQPSGQSAIPPAMYNQPPSSAYQQPPEYRNQAMAPPPSAQAGAYDEQEPAYEEYGIPEEQARASSLGDVLRERRVSAPSEVQQVPDQAVVAAPAKKGGGAKIGLIAVGAVLVVAVIAVAGLFGLGLIGGAKEDDGPDLQAEARKAQAKAMDTYRKYGETQERLRVLGQWNKAYMRTNGRWANKADELQSVGAASADMADGWGNPFEIRKEFIISAGADGTFDNDDDIWVDSDLGKIDGYEPKAPANTGG